MSINTRGRYSLSAVKPLAGYTYSPWVELGIVALYAAVLPLAGVWVLTHRDT